MIVALMGEQGSGKSKCREYLEGLYPSAVNFGIKSTFTGDMQAAYDAVANDYPERRGSKQALSAFKEFQKFYSTWAETRWNMDHWSNKFKEQVNTKYSCVPVLMDDCRTEMNLKVLMEVAKTRPVVVFRLNAPEEIRKQRVSVWREPNDYTEVLLERPKSLPLEMHWFEIDTSKSFEDTCDAIKKSLLEIGLL
jgi:dephospho-CoA kinase